MFVLSSVISLSCGSRIHTKEKVQEAIIARLQEKSGLDMNGLDVTTTSVSFNRNMAYATVNFHPKSDPTVNGGMTMQYTLEDRDGKWVVVKVGDSQGHGLMGQPPASGTPLPAGHPPVNSMGQEPGGMPPPNSGQR
jgi:hypothetical protein